MVGVARLLKEQNGTTYYKDVRVENDPERLRGLLNETRWQILKLLAERPRYPAEIADELEVHEQKVYYHIRELAESDIIEVVEKKERGGAVAKYYGVKDYGFVLELPFGEERVTDFSVTAEPSQLRSFLHPFVEDGRINTRIVVGSPDPHGPHQVRARDTHFAADLGLFMGQYGTFQELRTVLDVDLKASQNYAGNMVLLGGPLTNMVTDEFNSYLPIKFKTENFPFREIMSQHTRKEYSDDAIGFIARTPNPQDQKSAILVVAGVRMTGTHAAVLALTEHYDRILEDYEGEDTWGTVVQGKDMDGDGTIDEIDVLE